MFSLISPFVSPFISLLPGRVTLNSSEYDLTIWLLLGSNSLLGTAREGQLPGLDWLLSGFKGTCFLPVGTCLIGQLTSLKRNEQVRKSSKHISKLQVTGEERGQFFFMTM